MTLDDLARSYRAALLRYLPRRDEAASRTGYELGRAAVVDGISVLDLAHVHHVVLLELLKETSPGELPAVATAASRFFLEVLAPYDMTQRAFLDSKSA